ncbi:MAG: hypothetical protein ABW321_16110 [Polyangiales bacterium]
MRGYRIRIALLTLGVMFGYGSAIARGFYGHGHCHHHHGHHGYGGRDFHWDDDYDHPDKPPANPRTGAKPEN